MNSDEQHKKYDNTIFLSEEGKEKYLELSEEEKDALSLKLAYDLIVTKLDITKQEIRKSLDRQSGLSK